MSGDIEIHGVDLREFAKAAYDLSQPQGLGFLHFSPEVLTDDEADEIVAQGGRGKVVLRMDYVKGRAVKQTVWKREDGVRYIRGVWFDHTDEHLTELLRRVGVDR